MTPFATVADGKELIGHGLIFQWQLKPMKQGINGSKSLVPSEIEMGMRMQEFVQDAIWIFTK